MADPGVIDCDVHVVVPAVGVLFPFLTDFWRDYIRESAFKGPVDTSYPRGAATSVRPDLVGVNGRPPGADLDLLRERVLDPLRVEYGILTCAYALESVHNPFAAAALASAVNDWLIRDWLDREPRLRASIVVPSQDPELAAREIDRVGNHPGFVQVYLPVRSEAPYGNRRYYPIYAAALRHDLAIAIHFGGSPGNPPTAAGWPSFYVEEYAGMAHVFQSQLISLVSEGVFDQFPTLRVALLESGVTWLPALLWRLDKEWKGLRREVPWVRRPPSAYVRDHVRFSTQPLDLPAAPDRLPELLDQIGSDDLLLFATDFPHWHDDAEPGSFLTGLPAALARKIRRENALDFYRLPAQPGTTAVGSL